MKHRPFDIMLDDRIPINEIRMVQRMEKNDPLSKIKQIFDLNGPGDLAANLRGVYIERQSGMDIVNVKTISSVLDSLLEIKKVLEEHEE